MQSYYDSLLKNKTTSVFDKTKSVKYLKELREGLKNCDYIVICKGFYKDDNSNDISCLVNSIDSKILRAQELIEIKLDESVFNENQLIGIAFLHLWSTLNDIFYLRFNLKPDEWLMVDPNKIILKLAIKDGKLFKIIKFKGDRSNKNYISYAKRRFSSDLDKELNPDKYEGDGWPKSNEIFFLVHLISIYYNELYSIFMDCKNKRNYHELIHGLIGNLTHKKSDFDFDAIRDIGNIIEALLFLD